MYKQRSAGLNIFGWYGLVYFGIVGVILDLFKFPKFDLIKTLISIAYAILSYYLLRLKNWARIALLILNSIFAIIIVFINFTVLSLSYEQWLAALQTEYPLFPMWGIFDLVTVNLYYYGFIIFFTRRSVIQHFN
jgi:hypothetical protein